MWPVWIALRTYGPYITFPIALVAGFIGYNIERRVRKERREIEYLGKSIEQQRSERLLKEAEERKQAFGVGATVDNIELDSLKEKKYVPKSSLDRNPVGPSRDSRFL